jgi:Viral BACON domain
VNIGTNGQMNANYEVICAGCPGAFLGRATPPSGALSGGSANPYGIQVALNNSNTNGVQGDINGCETNGLPFGPQLVTKGIELAIPLGALGSPLSTVSVCAFITTESYAALYNQVLGPVWDGTTTYCEFNLSADGDSSEVNFQTLPGQHYFTIPVPSCSAIQASPSSPSFPSSGGTSSEALTMSGSCAWTATASTNWITITSAASGTGNGSFTYSVTNNPSIGPRTATFTVATAVATQIVTVTQDGIPLPIIVDGTVDPGYGCALAVQAIGTSFGKNTTPNAILAAGGSELDAAYGLIENNILYLFLAGNIQDNGNRVHIFFATGTGVTNGLTSLEVTNIDLSAGRSVLNWMGPTNNITPMGGSPLGPGPGLTFDPGFAPSYWIDLSCSATAVSFNYAQLWPGGTNSSGLATNGYFLGSNAGTNGVLTGGTNPFLIQATINNGNTNGVDNGQKNPANNFSYGCYTNAAGVPGAESAQALTVTNGIEMAIPLVALGSPTGSIAVCAFIGNNGSGLQVANQILGPIWDGTPDFCATGPGKTTNTWAPYLNLGDLPGTHYFYVGPEMRVTGVSVDSGKNVHVNFLTENNTNMTYQLQRATVLTTNTTWTSVGGLQLGTGGIITEIDSNGGTNKPGAFYRIRQTPLCLP